MGMAASQARYLALTARKTNTEWEGQQINQARTALANQSANLFNQLLALEVPNAPKTTDYTEVQYSFTDGDNESVIDSWQQLSTANPDYNYIVKSYYFANVYTGAEKKLENPQVHIKSEVVENKYVDPKAVYNDDGSCTITFPNGAEILCDEITNEKTENNIPLKIAFNDFAIAKNLAYADGIIPSEEVYGFQDAAGTWHFYLREEVDSIDQMKPQVSVDPINNTYTITTADGSQKITYESINDLKKDNDFQSAFNDFREMLTSSREGRGLNPNEAYAYQDANGNWNFYLKEEIENLNRDEYEVIPDIINNSFTIISADGSQTFNYKCINDVDRDDTFESAYKDFERASVQTQIAKALEPDKIYGYHDANGTWHFFSSDDIADPKEYTAVRVAYVGNSRADELGVFTDAQAAELAQILRDRPDSSVSNYLSFDDEGNLIYDGMGIYTFQMNGKTYFTTEQDLYHSINHPLEKRKPIDVQDYLKYYNANYVKTKIEKTNNALLETDGDGRFTSVKFDNDSVVYSLNFETVTNEAAYQDAMNQYLYKKAQYEKTIADINAQTSIIQQEDRTLELRLKQLDTEQNALATEMDAVKKVIKDNVEKTFKTFSE